MAPKYTKLSLVGSGSYGNVWIVNENGSPTNKVMKEVKLLNLSEKDVNQALEEVSALARCKHENIIRYYEAFVDRRAIVLSIIMEYASEGDLDKHIRERRSLGQYFPNDVILNWFTQLLSALTYIHSRGILHRDIKPQNIFVDENYVVKLGDFGICKILQLEADLALTMIGTPFYLSPEICLQQPYNCKSDMWSAGCVLYELCCLKLPFTATNIPSLTAQIIAGNYSPLPSNCDQRLCDAVRTLLVVDPEKRSSAEELLQSAELQEFSNKQRNVRPTPSPVPVESTRQGRKREACTPVRCENSPEWAKRGCCGQDPEKQASPYKGIDNRTYTIVRYPKLRHLSPASPELSQLLERQRSMSSPRQRVDEARKCQSVDAAQARQNQRRRKPKDTCLPRLNLLQAVQEMSPPSSSKQKATDCGPSYQESEIDSDTLEHIVEVATLFRKSAVSPDKEKAVEGIKNQMLALLGPDRLARVINAVRDGAAYSSLKQQFCLGSNMTQAILWYLHLQGLF
ncbi:serine/threonine-protein kinase Nek1 [Elysia marginata]|uniref:non-specific serine/threonine protein kinase n=1 Tax=Elysia marginata TaxID=1093978 RepID=A0AAV4HTC8_9GAST|nr:serine/threonine-protein kinase Nek1 [Elysia marginata]